MPVGRTLPALFAVKVAFLAVAGFGLAPITHAHASSAQTASLIDCREFIDQAEAQRFFEVKGGPRSDPYNLDGDGDGIACEPGPRPTPVSQSHAEYCEGFVDYLVDLEAPSSSLGERYRKECADYLEKTGQLHFCPAYEGLSFRYFSSLTRDQVNDLTEMQTEEYDYLMNLTEGECVPTDVARTSAWRCQPFPYYLAEYEEWSGMPITTYYRDELAERYQVVCMGAPITLGKSRTFSAEYLVGAAVVGAGAAYLYSRHRKNRETTSQT